MTRLANARIAGATFLIYIVAGISDMVLSGRITAGETVAARLSSIAQNAGNIRFHVLLLLVQTFSAMVLAVTLWAITRDQDPDIAMFGLVSRATEGVLGALTIPETLALTWLATATGPNAPDPASAQALAGYLFRGSVAFTATFFAVGSTCFAWLLLRGRMVPAALARLGVFASVLLVVLLPLQLAGFLRGAITQWIWLPMLLFELPLAVWFLVKGVAAPAAR